MSTGAASELVGVTDTLTVLPTSVAAQLGADVAQFRLPIDLPPIPIGPRLA